MNPDQIYSMASIIVSIGLIQTSVENSILALKYPATFKYNLSEGILRTNAIKNLRLFYDVPGVWIMLVIRVLLSVLLLITAIQNSIHYVIPTSLILIDVLAFPRWRFFSVSETPLQRSFLITLLIHCFFDSESISKIGLLFIALNWSLAYFSAGLQKLKDPNWLSGVSIFNYAQEGKLPFVSKPSIWKYLGYVIIFWELSFIFSLWGGGIMWFYLLTGVLFHVYLSVKNGFNFFLWTFLCGYPAIGYVAKNADQIFHIIF